MKKFTKTIVAGAMLGAVSMGILTAGVASATPISVDAAPSAKAVQQGSLVIKKLDKKNRPVAGSKFDISSVTGQFIKSVVTDKNGVAKTTLPVGSYNIKDATAIASGEFKGSIMYYIPVEAFKTQTVSFDNVYRETNGIM